MNNKTSIDTTNIIVQKTFTNNRDEIMLHIIPGIRYTPAAESCGVISVSSRWSVVYIHI